jgi:hypothetical protein
MKLAVAAGIDCLEHGIDLDDEVLETMRRRGVWLSAASKCTKIEGANRAEDQGAGVHRGVRGHHLQHADDPFRRALAVLFKAPASEAEGAPEPPPRAPLGPVPCSLR